MIPFSGRQARVALCACGVPPTGGRNQVSPVFPLLRICCLFLFCVGAKVASRVVQSPCRALLLIGEVGGGSSGAEAFEGQEHSDLTTTFTSTPFGSYDSAIPQSARRRRGIASDQTPLRFARRGTRPPPVCGPGRPGPCSCACVSTWTAPTSLPRRRRPAVEPPFG